MKITFTIDLEGNIKSDVEGGDGTNCLDATKPYEDALGDPAPEREMKAEASELNQTMTFQSTQLYV